MGLVTAFATNVIHVDRLNYYSTHTQQSAPKGERLHYCRDPAMRQHRLPWSQLAQRWRGVAPSLVRTDESQIVEIPRRCTPRNARAVSHFRSCCADVLWLVTRQQHSNRRDGACRPLRLTRAPGAPVCLSCCACVDGALACHPWTVLTALSLPLGLGDSAGLSALLVMSKPKGKVTTQDDQDA